MCNRAHVLLKERAARAGLLLLTACGGGDAPRIASSSDSAAARVASGAACGAEGTASGVATRRPMSAVQVGAFAESERAAGLRDSLQGAGWEAYLRDAPLSAGRGVTRVVVSPTADPELARYVAAAFRRAGRDALVVRDTTDREAAASALLEVNRGTHGMSARVRWALSPDRCTLLAVEDPVSIEAEPLPNGFLLASERGGLVLQQDPVWDVAPSPDWRRLAYGRAFIAQGGGADTLSAAQWRELARRVGLDLRVVREAAFRVSDMGLAYGAARVAVVDLGRAAEGGVSRADEARDSATTLLPIAAGWRVRWSPDGRSLIVGAGPTQGRDDAPPRGWLAVDAERFTPRGGPIPGSAAVSAAGMTPGVTAEWVEGPSLVSGAPAESTAVRAPISAGGRTVAARDGWITLAGAGAGDAPRIVGPGVPLAATATARFILALAPTADTAQYVQPVRLVVYRLRE